MKRQPSRISPRFVERVWGTTSLAPFYEDVENKVGEVWFSGGNSFPLLIKFIFTSERLSIQVHPDDDYASQHESSRGKTEMWHILAAEPGATIALGFREDVTKQQVREAIENGTIEELLDWVPVSAGQTYFTRAGVVHAIGAGVKLCEIQQNSEITYRLYDYGRPRELHVDKALDVLETRCYDGRREMPVHCKHFVTEMMELAAQQASDVSCDHMLVILEGAGSLGSERFQAGEVWMIPEGSEPVEILPNPSARLLRVRCGDQA